MSYPGGKAGAGVYQAIINQIPPHDEYIEPFLGDGAVLRRKRPAARSIAVESDGQVLDELWTAAELPDLELYHCDGVEWLKYHFGLYRVGPSTVAGSGGPGPTRVFVYCDPPYLLSTRSSGKLYRHELTDEQHLDLLHTIQRLPCFVMISGYWSDLYAAELCDWRSRSFQTTNRAGQRVTEWLWMNYAQPAELHDYSYLGADKREREKISRRVRNWTSGLARMPALERQALVAAISETRAADDA